MPWRHSLWVALLVGSLAVGCDSAEDDAMDAAADAAAAAAVQDVSAGVDVGASADPGALTDPGSSPDTGAVDPGPVGDVGGPTFSVSITASPASGPPPLNVTLIANVSGDLTAEDVDFQWYRDGAELVAINQQATMMLLPKTAEIRVVATWTGPGGATGTAEDTVTVTVTR